MRSIFITLCALTSMFVLPSEKAQAGHYTELAAVTCEYADAAELFHRSLCRSRRATDYSERLADRLAHAAGDLRDVVRIGADPRRIAIMYDEVFVLHDRLSELLGSNCRRPDPIVLRVWRPLDQAFERLVCAIEGCQPVCPLISHHHPSFGQPRFGHSAARPPIIGNRPGFNGFNPAVLPGALEHRNFDTRFGHGLEHRFEDRDRRGMLHPNIDPRRDTGIRRQWDRNQFTRDSRDAFRRDRNNDFRRAPEPRDLHSAAVQSILSRLFD